MRAVDASSVGRSGLCIPTYSQIANIIATHKNRKTGNDILADISQNAYMPSESDKNGGPNHLGEWMRFRNLKGAELAKELEISPGMVSDLVNSNRALSAKWLRRLAPVLKTTPGHLLDHNPFDLPTDIIDIWSHANLDQKKQLLKMAEVIVPKDGTNH